MYAKIVREPALLAVLEKGLDAYRATAAGMLGKPESEVTDEERQKAKAIVLGLLYGLSASRAPGLRLQGLRRRDSARRVEGSHRSFLDLYPAIAEDHEAAEAEVEDGGSADRKTLTGRRRDGITARNEAINMPIQGTAADVLKLAMGRLYRELSVFEDAFIVGAFHDELLVECNEGDAETIEKLTAKSDARGDGRAVERRAAKGRPARGGVERLDGLGERVILRLFKFTDEETQPYAKSGRRKPHRSSLPEERESSWNPWLATSERPHRST